MKRSKVQFFLCTQHGNNMPLYSTENTGIESKCMQNKIIKFMACKYMHDPVELGAAFHTELHRKSLCWKLRRERQDSVQVSPLAVVQSLPGIPTTCSYTSIMEAYIENSSCQRPVVDVMYRYMNIKRHLIFSVIFSYNRV